MRKQERFFATTLTQSGTESPWEGNWTHLLLPSLWVHSLLPMLDAQIAAERKHPLPQRVCRWIVALLWLLSAVISAIREDPEDHQSCCLGSLKPGMKLQPWSFSSQAAPGCCVSLLTLHLDALHTTYDLPIPWVKAGLGEPCPLRTMDATAAANPAWGKPSLPVH